MSISVMSESVIVYLLSWQPRRRPVLSQYEAGWSSDSTEFSQSNYRPEQRLVLLSKFVLLQVWNDFVASCDGVWLAQTVQRAVYGMDVSVFESRLRNGLTLKICRPNLKPSQPHVQRTRGKSSEVQVDLSSLCCTTCKTGFGWTFTVRYAFILSTAGTLIFTSGKQQWCLRFGVLLS